MRAAEESAISSGTDAVTLMERAGRAVARAAVRAAGGRYGRRAAVVCGKGNNGGDGFVCARVLAGEGMSVSCLTLGEAAAAKGAAREHLELLTSAGVSPRRFSPELLRRADVIVDAIFGTGFRGPAEREAAAAIEAINGAPAPVVSVDIPSGVDGATGRSEGPAVDAHTTVVMGAEKLGTASGDGAFKAGEVQVADIGVPVTGGRAFAAEASDVAAALPRRPPDGHKRSLGSVAILGGSAGMSGAVLLCARAAMRMGAGYVTVGATADVEQTVSMRLAEVLSSVVTEGDVLGPDSLDGFADVVEQATAIAVGPGLGRGDAQRALMDRVLTEVEAPVLVDADGLNVLAGHTQRLARRAGPAVLTPHPAELARLLDSSVGAVQSDRMTAATSAAQQLGAVVVLKGSRSIIAAPTGRAVVNPTGSSVLASAGTGDVLSGAAVALLAAGLDAFEAAWAATYVHGLAGLEALGMVAGPGVLAWDVAEALPRALLTVDAEAGGRNSAARGPHPDPIKPAELI